MSFNKNMMQEVAGHIQHFPEPGKLYRWIDNIPWGRFEGRHNRIFVQMVQTIDESSDQAKKDWIRQILRQAYFQDSLPCLLEIPAGSDFWIQIELNEGDDFTNHYILCRNADDGTLLSTAVAGDSYENAPIQEVKFENWGQPVDDFLRVNYNLEVDGEGEVVTLLNHFYIYTLTDIDNTSS